MNFETTPAPAGTGNEGKAQNGTTDYSPLNLTFPSYRCASGCTLAIMLKGREVSPLSIIFSEIHGTRLSGYIQYLEAEKGFQGCIRYRDLPYTPGQLKSPYRKQFRAYWLTQDTISKLGLDGQAWADKTLAFHNISANDFPQSRQAGMDR